MQVPLEVNSLDQGHAYLLDAGKVLYIWQGMQSTLNARSKARWEGLAVWLAACMCLKRGLLS